MSVYGDGCLYTCRACRGTHAYVDEGDGLCNGCSGRGKIAALEGELARWQRDKARDYANAYREQFVTERNRVGALEAKLEEAEQARDRNQRNLDTAQAALCGASKALIDSTADIAHGWLTRHEAYEKAAAWKRALESRAERAEDLLRSLLERLADMDLTQCDDDLESVAQRYSVEEAMHVARTYLEALAAPAPEEKP